MAADFAAGCIGGGVGVLVGHPFDTVKVLGLYKGLLSPLYGLAFMNAIVFGVQGNVQRRLPGKDSLLSHSVAGFVAGVAQSFVCSPTELAKIRMQNQGQGQTYKQLHQSGATYYKGPLDCLWKIYKSEGIYKGVFRGLGLTIMREGPSFGVYFPVFHGLCQYFTPPSEKYSVGTMLLAGGVSGMVTWMSTYPVDVIKTRYQDDAQHRYKNIRDCVMETYKLGGRKIFFQGLSVTLLRAFPTNAATFTVTMVILQNVFQKDDYD